MMRTQMARALTPVVIGAMAMSIAAPASAQRYGSRSVPANTIVRVKLEDELSTRNARVGDRFEARLDDEDRSGFPEGTRFEGSVTQVERPTQSRPGVLGMKIHRAILPDGRLVAATAFPASLQDEDVRRTENGRLESRGKSKGDKFDWKWVGYGAGGGAVLSTIFGGGFLKGALLGGVGGAIYSYLNRDKGKKKGEFRDVELDRGTEFGIRLYDRVAFNDSREYRYATSDDRFDDRDRVDDRDRYDDREHYEDREPRDPRGRYEDPRDERYDERVRGERYEEERRPAK
jgi:hypothetical protein